jgi:energy-converting hydrogenase Eha subunit H
MGKSISISRQTRRNFIELINSLSVEQLNEIPLGLNNNIVWNFGHIVVTQQILCYVLAGVSPKMDQVLIEKYRKGAKPEVIVDQAEIDTLISLANSLLNDLEMDLGTDLFSNYKTYLTSYGFELTCIEDAIDYFVVHESMHYGVALTIKKLVTKS